MGDNEGFTQYTVTKKSCLGCKYHTNRLVRSGRDPLRNHYCNHPDMGDDNLNSITNEKGRFIGASDETPRWCPYLPKEQK